MVVKKESSLPNDVQWYERINPNKRLKKIQLLGNNYIQFFALRVYLKKILLWGNIYIQFFARWPWNSPSRATASTGHLARWSAIKARFCSFSTKPTQTKSEILRLQRRSRSRGLKPQSKVRPGKSPMPIERYEKINPHKRLKKIKLLGNIYIQFFT